MESSFFPVPVELVLIPLSITSPNLFWLFALIASAGSVIGGVIGYYIGRGIETALIEKVFSKKSIKRTHNLFLKYEMWAVFVGGFTPLPYKLFAITAGLFYLDLKKFIFISAVARTLRFLLVAGVVALFAGTNGYVKIVNWLTIAVSLILIGVIALIKIQKRESRS